MNLSQRIQSFAKLGEKLKNPLYLQKAIQESTAKNPWFLEQNILYAIDSIAGKLEDGILEKWVQPYQNIIRHKNFPQNILIVMAGNIPLVGFHDFLCVLMSGNRAILKLSSNDKFLLPVITEQLITIEPRFKDLIFFVSNNLSELSKNQVDAIIATGSDNSARYFEYYFSQKPHIIRRNRSSVAILTGAETQEELELLADDMFLHFSLGCRNVSKLFVPENYDFTMLSKACIKYEYLLHKEKFMNNYHYQKAIHQMNNLHFQDEKFFIFTESNNLSSPLAVIYFEHYQNIETIKLFIQNFDGKLQCIVGSKSFYPNAIPFGKAQQPELTDYADNIDTMQWLNNLFNE